ncbi:MAG: hypothetical protein ACK4MF_02760 [Hyphomicrobiaceae bacterium]
MSLENCPKMAQRCPHRTIGCDGAEGDECHYVTAALGSAVTALTVLRSAEMARAYPYDSENERRQDQLLALVQRFEAALRSVEKHRER